MQSRPVVRGTANFLNDTYGPAEGCAIWFGKLFWIKCSVKNMENITYINISSKGS